MLGRKWKIPRGQTSRCRLFILLFSLHGGFYMCVLCSSHSAIQSVSDPTSSAVTRGALAHTILEPFFPTPCPGVILHRPGYQLPGIYIESVHNFFAPKTTNISGSERYRSTRLSYPRITTTFRKNLDRVDQPVRVNKGFRVVGDVVAAGGPLAAADRVVLPCLASP